MSQLPHRSTSWVVALALTLVATGGARAQSDGDHRYTSEAIEAGSRLYMAECAICHGPNGDEVDGLNLRTGAFRNVRSDDDIRAVVRQGVDGRRMPAFDLRPEEMDGIVAYIRAGFDPSGVAVRVGDAERGALLFTRSCARCHRVNGVGPRTAPDLSEIGAIRTPAALQRTLLDPASALLPINRPVRIVTAAGEEFRGRRLNEDTHTVQMIDQDERLRSFLKADLVEFEVSDRPTMRPTAMSGDEVADLVGYLLTLQGVR